MRILSNDWTEITGAVNMTAVNFDGEPPLALEAEILYEDFATGLRAHFLVHQMKACLGAGIHVIEHLWRLDVLRHPELRNQAVEEARPAQVVVVSAHGDGALPGSLKDWTTEWLPRRSKNALGVILSLDARLERLAAGLPFVHGFQHLLGKSPLDLVLCFGEGPIASALTERHEMNEHRREPLARLGDSGDWCYGIRESGINE